MIKALTSWRGIFALCIVYFHLGMQEFTQMAVIAVTFFFMVSGFLVAMHNTGYGTNIKLYYKRRLWRIFPLHWLALALLIILDLAYVCSSRSRSRPQRHLQFSFRLIGGQHY